MGIQFQSDYLATSRGITKLIQIIFGLIVTSILCGNWYGGTACFSEGRLGYVSGLNFIVLIANVIFLLLNLFNIHFPKIEQLYNVLATVLFLVAVILFVWYMISESSWSVWRIATGLSIIIIFALFQWDFRSNRMSDEHLPLP